ncbi:MAG: hypothetical protein LH702_12545 [Phormidesmis sp. CAN_BIN44]|nr:hypothetical protein [Phormidesmis sp. CAN_BIN44]
MSNSSLLILLASDTLTHLYLYPDSSLGIQRWRRCQSLLPKIQQYRHVSTLTVVTVTLNYFFSSHVESDADEHLIQEIIGKLEKDGIEIPLGYRFERVALDQPEALSKAELKHAIANQFTALITYDPRYVRHFRNRVHIWNIEQLFNRLALEHSYQTSSTTAENDSQANQPSTQTSEPETRSEASPSKFRTLVVRLLMIALGSQLLHRADRSSRSQSTRQTSRRSGNSEVIPERRTIEFHAPTTSSLDINAALNPSRNAATQAFTNTFSNANDGRLTQLANRGGQFSGLWLLLQISPNHNSADSAFETTQRSSSTTSSSLVPNYDLSALMNFQNTESQCSGFLDRASREGFESDRDRAIFIPNPFIFAGSDFDNPDTTDFDATLLLRFNLPEKTPRSPSIPSNQTNPTVSLVDPIRESANQPRDRPDLSANIGRVSDQEPEKTNSIVTPEIVTPEIVVVVPPQVLDGSGGRRSFTLTTGSYEVRNFGGVGTDRNPSENIIREVDALYFQGSQLTAKNLLLDQQGKDLFITFEGEQNINILLKVFEMENLDNFLTTSKAPVMLANIMFSGDSTQDSFDVVNADLIVAQVFNRNSVIFLNDLDNNVIGFDDSNDVINGQGGNDFLQGLGGDDILRGGAGDDILWGGTGADILDGGTGINWLTGGAGADIFRLYQGGLSQVIDFQVGEDRIGLPTAIQINQVAIEQGTGLNSSSTLIRFKPDGSLLMSLLGVAANSLTTDIFLPSASSLVRQ